MLAWRRQTITVTNRTDKAVTGVQSKRRKTIAVTSILNKPKLRQSKRRQSDRSGILIDHNPC